MRRKNINYKPSRPQAAMGLAIGAVFIFLGLGMVIPMAFASGSPFIGLFGVAWRAGRARTSSGATRSPRTPPTGRCPLSSPTPPTTSTSPARD